MARRRTKADYLKMRRQLEINMGLCISDQMLKELRTPGTPEFRESVAAGIVLAELLPMPVFMAIYYQRVKAAGGMY